MISTKELTADLVNKDSILNGGKYFSSNGQQNYLAFISNRHVDFINNGSDIFELWIPTGIAQKCIKN